MAIANRHGGRRPSRLKSDRTVISIFTYSYDNAGNRTGVQEASGDRVTWSYDSSYQLTREQRSGANAYDVTYTYDTAGNRTVKLEAGVRTTYSYDNANQLSVEYTPSARTTYTYDANGNTSAINAAGSRTTYTWDIGDHITAVQLPGGARNTYTYDGQGKRRRMEDSEGVRNIIWDVETVARETDQSNATIVAYTTTPSCRHGSFVSQRRSGQTSYYHFDVLGSSRDLTSSAQVTTDSRDYRAFGVTNASSGATANRLWWVGQLGYYWQPDTSDYWMRARVYRPATGSWLSRDPSMDEPAYNYVRNGPLTAVDPSGLSGDYCDALLNVVSYGTCIAKAIWNWVQVSNAANEDAIYCIAYCAAPALRAYVVGRIVCNFVPVFGCWGRGVCKWGYGGLIMWGYNACKKSCIDAWWIEISSAWGARGRAFGKCKEDYQESYREWLRDRRTKGNYRGDAPRPRFT